MAFELQGGYATPRADLGVALAEYRREGGGNWATPKILPTLTVTKKTATFSAYPRASLLLTGDAKRAFGGTYNRITAGAVDHTYNTQNYGLEHLVDDKQRGFLANDFDTDFAATMFTDMRIRRIQEVRAAALLFSTATFTGSNFTDKSSTDPWTNLSADIFGTVLDAIESSRRQTGMPPNTILVGKPVFNLMKKNTALAARRNVTTLLVSGDEEMKTYFAQIFGVDQFIVADEVYNSAGDNGSAGTTPAASITDIWAKQYCLVAYCAKPGAPLEEPSLGRLITWDYVPELAVTSYREEARSSDVIRVEHFVQEFLYDQAYGNLIKVQT